MRLTNKASIVFCFAIGIAPIHAAPDVAPLDIVRAPALPVITPGPHDQLRRIKRAKRAGALEGAKQAIAGEGQSYCPEQLGATTFRCEECGGEDHGKPGHCDNDLHCNCK